MTPLMPIAAVRGHARAARACAARMQRAAKAAARVVAAHGGVEQMQAAPMCRFFITFFRLHADYYAYFLCRRQTPTTIMAFSFIFHFDFFAAAHFLFIYFEC